MSERLQVKLLGLALLVVGGLMLSDLPWLEYAGIGLVAMGCVYFLRPE